MKFIVAKIILFSLIPARQIVHPSDLKLGKRIIVVVDDENFEFNNRAKKHLEELKERDISVIFYNKGIAYLNNKIISDRFTKSVKKNIKKIKSTYRLILEGKDGGVKNTYPYETKLNEIVHHIDQMPMRKTEMRKSLKN